MNWKLILPASLFGVAIGVGSLFGLVLSELLFWLLSLNILLVCALLIATYAPGKYFVHGFLVGLLSQIWFTAIHGYYLFDTSTNAGIVEISPDGIHPQVMNLILGLITGAVTGVIVGLFSFVAAKMLKQVPAPESQSTR